MEKTRKRNNWSHLDISEANLISRQLSEYVLRHRCDGSISLVTGTTVNARVIHHKESENWFRSPLDLVLDKDVTIQKNNLGIFTCKHIDHSDHTFILHCSDTGRLKEIDGRIVRVIEVMATRISDSSSNPRPSVTKLD